jgi:hypothetical protein
MRKRRQGQPGANQDHPIYFAFGREPIEFLSAAQAAQATPQERLRSVWPFLVECVREFAATLRPRQLANFDPEDVLCELTQRLLQRDRKWNSERGTYLSFAAAVAKNELKKIRDQTRTVRSPGNSSSRLREYEADAASGSLTPEREKTLVSLRRVLACQDALDPQAAGESIQDTSGARPDELVVRGETHAAAAREVTKAIMGLDPIEAKIIGRAFGLWGQDCATIPQIARDLKRSPAKVREAYDVAIVKLRDRLGRVVRPDDAPDTSDRGFAA